jgi:pimeloyl-ACP methyl ester carboxylesterase
VRYQQQERSLRKQDKDEMMLSLKWKQSALAVLSILGLAIASPLTSSHDIHGRDDIWDAIKKLDVVGNPANDYNCKSQVHPNPIILLHALLANPAVDLNLLQRDLNSRGYCTFSVKYGQHTLAPWIGGLTDMRTSSKTIADFILDVVKRTGSNKVDIVGHSEGGVMSLYVPMVYKEVSAHVDRIVSLGPAVHGAQYYGLTSLWYAGGDISRDLASSVLHFLGCAACDDMADGGNIYNDFKAATRIVHPGNKATIIMSKSDTLVAPDRSIVNESDVQNVFVQDFCPDDQVGHAGLAWDTGVWDIIRNVLADNLHGPVACKQGLGA